MEKNSIFSPLFYGAINPNKLTVKKTPDLLKKTALSEKFIKNEWRRKVAAGLKTWPNDTKPTRYHFGRLKITTNAIKIIADPTLSYQNVIGSRPEVFKKLFKREYRPIPLSVSMAIIAKNQSGEKMLGLTIRSIDQDSSAGGFHVTTGGAIEVSKDEKPIDAALRETWEEIGIRPAELSQILCRAIVYNPRLSEIGIIFIANSKITTKKILSRKHDGENKLLFIPLQKANLEYWLLRLTHASSIDGIISMLTIGKDLYGEEWAENILKNIIKKNKGRSNEVRKKQLEKIDIKKLKKVLKKLKRQDPAF